MDETKCPNCGEKITSEQLGYFFQERYNDGAVETVKCESCDTLFTLTLHYAPYYTVNQCGFDSTEDNACATSNVTPTA